MIRKPLAIVFFVSVLFYAAVFHDLISTTAVSLYSQTANVVGVSVGVAQNELNEISAELTARENELKAREIAIRDREQELARQFGGGENERRFIYFVLAFVSLLTMLMLLNFYYDWRWRTT